MQSSLTHFGQQYLSGFLRLRVAASALALVVACTAQLAYPTFPLAPLLIFFVLDFALNVLLRLVEPRLPGALLVHLTLWIDTIAYSFTVFYSGGLQSIFITFYIWQLLIAAFWLGIRWFSIYGVVVLSALLVQVALTLANIHAPAFPQSIFILLLLPFGLLILLAILAYFLAQASGKLENEMHVRQTELLTQRDEKTALLAQAQKRAAQLELVSDIATRAGTIHDAQELMAQVVSMVVERFDYQLVAFLLWNCAHDALETNAAAGPLTVYFVEPFRHPASVGIIGWVARTGKTYLARDVRTDEHYTFLSGDVDPTRSELAIPLRRGAAVIGVLDVESTELDAFDAGTVAAMETLAEQISAALEKSQALAAQQKRAAQLALVNRVAAHIARLLPVKQLLQEAVESIQSEFGYFNTSIFLNEPERHCVIHIAGAGKLGDIPPDYRLAWSSGIIGHVGEIGQTYICNNKQADIYYTPVPWLAENDPVHSEIAVPLVRAGHTLGVLDIQSEQLQAFDATDIAAMEVLAEQLASALDNAQLYANTQNRTRELEVLYQVSQRLNSSLSVKGICQACVDALCDILGYEQVSIYFCEADALHLQAQHGYAIPIEVLDLNQGVLARAVQSRETIFLPDVTTESEFIAAISDLQSEIALPLVRDERVFGGLNVETLKPRHLTPEDVQLLTTVANQLAIAVENGQLFAQTQQDAEVKTALLREMSHRIKNNLSALSSLLHLALDQTGPAREKLLEELLARTDGLIIMHTLLARSEHARVSLRELGTQTLHNVVRHLAPLDNHLEIMVEGSTVEVVPRQIIPIALVLNELATNAVRHGFIEHQRTSGHLSLELGPHNGTGQFTLADDGYGLPVNFQLEENSGLGLSLLRTLVERDLKGSLKLERREGWTRATVQFTLEK